MDDASSSSNVDDVDVFDVKTDMAAVDDDEVDDDDDDDDGDVVGDENDGSSLSLKVDSSAVPASQADTVLVTAVPVVDCSTMVIFSYVSLYIFCFFL